MEFTKRKLSIKSKDLLQKIAVSDVSPFALMFAPVYLRLGLNEKFISVKAPLDFFTPEELKKLGAYNSFYLPKAVSATGPFRKAAQSIRALYSVEPKVIMGGEIPVPMTPTPFELSNETLKIVGKLWWKPSEHEMSVEPFLVTAFTNELCDLMPEEVLYSARERGVATYDKAVVYSSWAVFLALHLSYCDLDLLNELRFSVFSSIIGSSFQPLAKRSPDLQELVRVASLSLEASGSEAAPQLVRSDVFDRGEDRCSLRIASRLQRIRDEFAGEGSSRPTVYGIGGIFAA